MPAYSFKKAQTCYGPINPGITKSDWNLADRRSVSLEVSADGYDASPVNGITYNLKWEDVPHFADLIQKAFDAFILEHNYNADQTRFLRTVQTLVMQKRQIKVGDLYEPPFTNFGLNAVEKLFNEREVNEILKMTNVLIAKNRNEKK
jgi:hypothetical protein